MSRYTPSPLRVDQVQDTDRGGWLRDLALSYQEAGDALFVRGHFTRAFEKYQASLNLFDRLATNESDNSRAQVDLANVRARITDAHAVAAKAQVVQLSVVTKTG